MVTDPLEMPLIDLHSHILPQVDDGARDDDEAATMLRLAAADGTRVIAATPHADRAEPDQIMSGVQQLNQIAADEGLDIRVVTGSEVRIAADLPERFRDGQLITLNETSYFLLELWLLGEWPPYLRTAIYELQRAGLNPILAHAERYPAVQSYPTIVADLVDAGVLIQVNADAFLREGRSQTRRTAETLLQRGLVHLLASDAHHAQFRTPCLGEAFDYVMRVYGADYAVRLQATAEAVLQGRTIKLPEPDLSPSHSWFGRVWDRIAGR